MLSDEQVYLKNVIDAVRLRFVRLESANVERLYLDDDSANKDAFEGEVAIQGVLEEDEQKENRWLTYLCDLSVANLSRGDDSFKYKAQFRAVYKVIDRALKIEEKQVDLFSRHITIFTVWPYWRELVQSMSGRMSIRPVTLPLYNPTMTDSPFDVKNNPKLTSAEIAPKEN